MSDDVYLPVGVRAAAERDGATAGREHEQALGGGELCPGAGAARRKAERGGESTRWRGSLTGSARRWKTR